MPKRKKRKTYPKFNKPISSIIKIVLIFIIIIFSFTFYIYLENEEQIFQEQQNKIKKQKEFILIKKKKQEEQLHQEQQARYFEEKTKAMEIEYVQEIIAIEKTKPIKKAKNVFQYFPDNNISKKLLKPIFKNEQKEKKIQKPEVIKTLKIVVPQIIKELPSLVEKKKKKVNPKIVIIIDDVTSKAQISLVNKIPFPVTMSFLPPTKKHINSAKITKNIPIYMIHLPLEASTRAYEEENTLYINDSLETIDKRINSLKKLYPKAKYINNHTGSKFTANKTSMNKLLKTLKKYNYIFVDSRTTAKTATAYYAQKYNLKYFSRNIFLDNKREKRYIQKQLQKAVRIAKRDGYSIAIGHPHTITLKTLAQSKNLLKGLDVVLVDKL